MRVILSLFVLLSAVAASAAGPTVSETTDTIELRLDDRPVLTYHKAVVPPPEGADARFARSGFIHPLHAPAGGVVTSIHASDHIHHYGLWHAWVQTEHRGKAADYWNVKGGTATVRFAGTVRLIERAGEAAGFVVRQEHVTLAEDGSVREVVLDEELEVVLRADPRAFVIDYTMRQRNATDAPLVLPAYRYGGGIAYRSPLAWDRGNSEYLSSDGATRENGHEARARWMAMWGPTAEGEATVAIMDHPGNHDAPQRMRVWPDGKVFFNFVPTQETGWSIAPGVTETLRYRVVVSDGRPSPTELNETWQHFAEAAE